MPKVSLEKAQCEEILQSAEVIYLAMCAGDKQPYCLPFNFFYTDDKVYLHTGFRGTKWDIIRDNPKVCLTALGKGIKRPGDNPCQYSYDFESVIAFGEAVKVDSREETKEALDWIIKKYGEGDIKEVPEEKLDKVCIMRIDLEEIKGRKNS